MNAKEITGKAVLSVTSGARLGRVEALLLDPGSLALAALRVAVDGQQAVIPFDQVQSLGSDAVMVPSDDVAQWIATTGAAEGLVAVDALTRYKVVDDAGTLLGTPQAIELDPSDGRLQQLTVHKGGVLGVGGERVTLAASALVSVGADVIVVRASPSPA